MNRRKETRAKEYGQSHGPQPEPPVSPWSATRRNVVSALLVLHVLAVFSAPWSEPPPSSQLARSVARPFRPYLKFMSLDNGYRFFAPDPGPSNLIRYEVLGKDGEVTKGVFPNQDEHWPRLLYHRYFMVSEMVASLAGPTLELPPNQLLTEQEREQVRERRRITAELQRGIANVILRQHEDANGVKLFLTTHAIPTPADVVRGMPLNDPALYRDILLGEFQAPTTEVLP